MSTSSWNNVTELLLSHRAVLVLLMALVFFLLQGCLVCIYKHATLGLRLNSERMTKVIAHNMQSGIPLKFKCGWKDMEVTPMCFHCTPDQRQRCSKDPVPQNREGTRVVEIEKIKD